MNFGTKPCFSLPKRQHIKKKGPPLLPSLKLTLRGRMRECEREREQHQFASKKKKMKWTNALLWCAEAIFAKTDIREKLEIEIVFCFNYDKCQTINAPNFSVGFFAVETKNFPFFWEKQCSRAAKLYGSFLRAKKINVPTAKKDLRKRDFSSICWFSLSAKAL